MLDTISARVEDEVHTGIIRGVICSPLTSGNPTLQRLDRSYDTLANTSTSTLTGTSCNTLALEESLDGCSAICPLVSTWLPRVGLFGCFSSLMLSLRTYCTPRLTQDTTAQFFYIGVEQGDEAQAEVHDFLQIFQQLWTRFVTHPMDNALRTWAAAAPW